MLSVIRFLGWLACVVYSTIPAFWILIHGKLGYWRSREFSPHCVIVPLWIAMWVVMGAATWPWRQLALYKTWWTWLPAAALLGCGFWIYRHSKQDFSTAQLSGIAEIRQDHPDRRLVTSGLRARVRHPVYLGHLCEMLAWSIGTGTAVLHGLTAFAMITGAFMIRMEEAELEQRFGEPYRIYRQRVPAVFPSLRTKPVDLASNSHGPI